MPTEQNSNNSGLNRENAQVVLGRAQEERIKTEADLADARAQLKQAKDTLDEVMTNGNVEASREAVDAATENTRKLEAELNRASEKFKEVEAAHERAEDAKSLARSTYKSATRYYRVKSFTKLENRLERARSEFEAARTTIRFSGGDATKASDTIARAEAELAKAQEAHNAAEANLEPVRAEVDAAVAQYLNDKNPETERRYDAALIARGEAEKEVEYTAWRLKEAIARNDEAQKSAYIVKDAERAQAIFEKKKKAFEDATKALNQAKSAQKVADHRKESAEYKLEAKTSELEAAADAVNEQRSEIAQKLDELKEARKELAVKKSAHDKALSIRAGAEQSVRDAQERVEALVIRLQKLNEISEQARRLLSE